MLRFNNLPLGLYVCLLYKRALGRIAPQNVDRHTSTC